MSWIHQQCFFFLGASSNLSAALLSAAFTSEITNKARHLEQKILKAKYISFLLFCHFCTKARWPSGNFQVNWRCLSAYELYKRIYLQSNWGSFVGSWPSLIKIYHLGNSTHLLLITLYGRTFFTNTPFEYDISINKGDFLAKFISQDLSVSQHRRFKIFFWRSSSLKSMCILPQQGEW